MTSPLSALQTALYSRLTGDAPLTALLAAGAGGILDHVPAGTPFPYIVLGEATQTPIGTQDGVDFDITLNIQGFSRYNGFAEIQNIMSAISTALENAVFPVSGHQLVLCLSLDSSTLLEGDGETRSSLQRFRIVLSPL